MTLDDLNDDDFDPRAEENPGDSSDTSDDFNPRSGSLSATPVSVKPVSAASPPSSAPPTRILPPPSLPPRDPTKLPAPAAAAPPRLPAPVLPNPFAAPAPSDPFGMSTFSSGAATQIVKDPFSSDVFGGADFSLDELDPLKK